MLLCSTIFFFSVKAKASKTEQQARTKFCPRSPQDLGRMIHWDLKISPRSLLSHQGCRDLDYLVEIAKISPRSQQEGSYGSRDLGCLSEIAEITQLAGTWGSYRDLDLIRRILAEIGSVPTCLMNHQTQLNKTTHKLMNI